MSVLGSGERRRAEGELVEPVEVAAEKIRAGMTSTSDRSGVSYVHLGMFGEVEELTTADSDGLTGEVIVGF